MTEDVQVEVLKRTQESLGRFIKKPILSEKLLRKPPFRFLHDICTSAMKETGFFEDTLSGNDVKVELINDKEGKIAFLQKVIAAVEAANNVKLTVKPNKIVAGHEPIKTNEFLQALAFALEKQVETKAPKKAIRKAKAAAAKADPKEPQEETVKRKNLANKAPKASEPPVEPTEIAKKDPKKRKPREVKPEVGSDETRKKPVGKEASKVKKKPESKEKAESNGHGGEEEVRRNVEGKTAGRTGKKRVGSNAVEKEAEIIREPTPEQALEAEVVELVQDLVAPETNGLDETDVKPVDPPNRPVSAKLKRRTPSARTSSARPALTEDHPPEATLEIAQAVKASEAIDRVLGGVVFDSPDPAPVTSPAPATPPAPVADPTPGPTPLKALVPAATTSTKSGVARSEPVVAPRPRTAIRPPSARPASARPAAPRVRDRGQVALQEEVLKPAVGKVNLIADQEEALDDEELVSVQSGQERADVDVALNPTAATTLGLTEPASDAADGSTHGHLVAQILEAQKELEEDAFAKKGAAGRTEIEWSAVRSADGARREVERLRTAVQGLTRAAHPLGKLLEYMQEDVDSMQHELTSWRDRNSSLSAKLEQERSLTDKSIEPLRVHLDELDQSMALETEQIAALKAAILRNDAKITHLMATL